MNNHHYSNRKDLESQYHTHNGHNDRHDAAHKIIKASKDRTNHHDGRHQYDVYSNANEHHNQRYNEDNQHDNDADPYDSFELHNEQYSGRHVDASHVSRHKPTKGEIYESQAKRIAGVLVYDDEISELEQSRMNQKGWSASNEVAFTFGGGDDGRPVTCRCNKTIYSIFCCMVIAAVIVILFFWLHA